MIGNNEMAKPKVTRFCSGLVRMRCDKDMTNFPKSTSSADNLPGMPDDTHRPTILLIEDDLELSNAIVEELDRRQYIVSHVQTGSEGIAKVRDSSFDILILDRMLPEVDGLTIMKSLRAVDQSTPVLIISALGEVDERVIGLDAGADDYLIKPFSFAELGARIEALLRRPLQIRATMLQVGSLSLDLLQRVVNLDGKAIELSSREFQLLEYFMARPGQLLTREMLLQNVWKFRFSPQTNVVDVHIRKLRQKIDITRSVSFIKNVRGYGFVFEADV
jgi:two-component system OmpR family response regulator